MTTNISTESGAVAVAEPVFDATDQHSWSSEQREEWNRTGDVPAPPKKDPQDSAPASSSEKKTVTTEPKGKSAAESGAAHKQDKPGKPTADERIGELTGEIKRLQGQLEEVTRRKPEPKAAEPAKPVEPPKRPNPFTWTGTPEEFDKAMDAYDIHIRQQAVRETQQTLQMQQTQRDMDQMLAKAAEKHPDAREKIAKTAFELGQAPIFVQAFIQDSTVLDEVLYTLSDPVTMKNLLDTAKVNPAKALRVLRDMERDIEQATAKPAANSPKEDTPVTPKPRAPKPPSEVGGRGTIPEDELAAAAKAGDFRSFEAEQNRRIRAARG